MTVEKFVVVLVLVIFTGVSLGVFMRAIILSVIKMIRRKIFK
jgi:hypothetical protein